MEHEGWSLETTHADCAECDANAETAWGFAVDWGSTAHQHSTVDAEGIRHVGTARRLDEESS